MDTVQNAFSGSCRRENTCLVQSNFRQFRLLVDQAAAFNNDGKYHQAAVHAEIAASYASANHCGLFTSPELERILLTLGRMLAKRHSYSAKRASHGSKIKNVLHVATVVLPVGGHSRMLWRWIQQDSGNVHSLLLTRQVRTAVPGALLDAVARSGGAIHRVNDTVGGILAWAKQLRILASAADIVVLHVHNYDVVPMIALAEKSVLPPIIFVNHGDHIFWLGAGISDIVVNLRESGMRLSRDRRGIQVERNLLLPTVLEPVRRLLPRQVAKSKLGLPKACTVCLCIARAVKFRALNGVNYADAHVPFLERHEDAILIVVGANGGEWEDASKRVGGRIIVHPERQDTALFYQAADIYVDSYPFVSITSLLEAAMYGLPLVTRCPYSEQSEIFGADMPSLNPNMIRARDRGHYTEVLSLLVRNEKYRVALGERTRRSVIEAHTGAKWISCLGEVYQAASTVSRVDAQASAVDRFHDGEPDVLMPYIYGQNASLDEIIKSKLRIMPLGDRTRVWLKFFAQGKLGNSRYPGGAFMWMCPEWLLCRTRVIWSKFYKAER